MPQIFKMDFRKSLAVFLLLFGLSLPAPVLSEAQVYFNLNTHKVHKMSCHSGKSCTVNCVTIPRSEAYRKGGVACRNCGG